MGSGFRVQVDGFKVVVAASLQNIYLRRSRHHHFSFLVQVNLSNGIKERHARGLTLTLKFESRDEWLGIWD